MIITSVVVGNPEDQLRANEDAADTAISEALSHSVGVRVDPNDDGTVTCTTEDPDQPAGTISWGGRYIAFPIEKRRRNGTPPGDGS